MGFPPARADRALRSPSASRYARACPGGRRRTARVVRARRLGEWSELGALLPYLNGFRCALLDRPGCGASPPYEGDIHTIDRFLEYADTLLVDVLDALEAPTARIVSTSLGGCFALRGAAAHPDRIDRMVEFGFVVGAPIGAVPISMRLATMPGVRRLMTSIPPPRGAVRTILRQLGLGPALADGRITAESFEWFVSLLRDTPTLRNESGLPHELLEASVIERFTTGRTACGRAMPRPVHLGRVRSLWWRRRRRTIRAAVARRRARNLAGLRARAVDRQSRTGSCTRRRLPRPLRIR